MKRTGLVAKVLRGLILRYLVEQTFWIDWGTIDFDVVRVADQISFLRMYSDVKYRVIRPAKYCNLKHCVVHIDETHFFFVMNISVIVRVSFVDDLAFAVNKKCVLRYFIPD